VALVLVPVESREVLGCPALRAYPVSTVGGDQQRNRSPIARKPRYAIISMTTVRAIANNGRDDAKF